MQKIHNFWLFITLLHCSSQEEPQTLPSLKGPSDLIILNKSEREIKIQWSAIDSSNVKRYHIIAEPILKESFMSQPPSKLEWTFGNNINNTNILGLEPGTQYNISVFAATNSGNTESTSKLVWTLIAAPNKPLPVEIIKQEGKLMHVRLHVENSDNGNSMYIKVIVVEKSPRLLFNPIQLKNYSEAEKSGVPFYITAELSPEEAGNIFVVGDGKMYRGYYNAPLIEGKAYEIIQGITKSLNGVTKSSFSEIDPSHLSSEIAKENTISDSSNPVMTVILATAIGVFGFLLLVSFVLYYLLQRKYGKHRSSDELILNIHGSESENGSIPGFLQMEEDTNLSNFFDTLREKYWHIPRNHIDIHKIVLGQGQFGEVREGIVHYKSHDTPSVIQRIHVPTTCTMNEKERKNMLLQLEATISVTVHPHIVEFIGIYEERDILYVVIENHQSTLRGKLLRSRQQVDGCVCCFSATHLIEILLSITQGMIHLSECGITHHHLSSRSIVMDGYVAKIANFGLSFYNPLGKELDFTRWTAPESLESTIYTVKSDVWSFGILLWEICALGGTPYVALPTTEVKRMILQDMRLPQLKGVSDELYQLMLHCWEFDFDKRPTFHEIAVVLQNILGRAKDHLRLNFYPGFQYEKFDPSADEV